MCPSAGIETIYLSLSTYQRYPFFNQKLQNAQRNKKHSTFNQVINENELQLFREKKFKKLMKSTLKALGERVENM